MAGLKDDAKDRSVQDVLVAFALLSRLPLPDVSEAALARGARASWAYPLVGLGLGLLGAVVVELSLAANLGTVLSAALGILAMTLMTGALHLDGLADCADGFWGGFTRERRLEIMKDSRIGTYGVLALIFGVGLEWQMLTRLVAQEDWIGRVIAPAMLSRAVMVGVMRTLPPARREGLSVSVGRPGSRDLGIAFALAAVTAALLIGVWPTLMAGAAAIAGGIAVAMIARAKIDGQTGDVLGAVQVTSMLFALASLI